MYSSDISLVKKSSQLLPNDNLTIVCDISISSPKELVSVSNTSNTEQLTVNQKREVDHLNQDLVSAYLSKEFSDVQLQCGDQVFECHQFMLSARSPVFKAMFLADMAEKKTKKVNVKDFHPDVLSELLTYIYSGKTSKMDNYAKDLLAAAAPVGSIKKCLCRTSL